MDPTIVDEIVSLESLRMQKIFGLFGHVLVMELFSQSLKRIYFVFDYQPKTPTFHLQINRPMGKKTSNSLIIMLNKYAINRSLRFFKLDEQGSSVKALFESEGQTYSLVFSLESKFVVGLFRESTLLTSLPPNDAPLYRFGLLTPLEQITGIKANLLQAKKHEEALLSFHKEDIFRNQIAQTSRELNKKKALLKNVEQDLLACYETLQLENTANLLKFNLHLVKRGMAEVEVMDYSADPPAKTRLKLDRKLSPEEFLAKTFTKIKKAKRGIGIISSRIKTIREEIEVLLQEQKDMKERGPAAITLEDIGDKIEAEQKSKKAPIRLPYRSFTSSDQIPILVGKSAKDSDTLTFRYAKGNEWWLHVRDVAGAHVVVKSSDESLPYKTLREAALLAQHFSKNRDNTSSAVSYTRVKHVQKKKGLPPGKVLITQEKTLQIEANKETLKALLDRQNA